MGSALPAGAVVQWPDLDNPQGFGDLAPGVIVEYQSATSGSTHLGPFVANGLIMTRRSYQGGGYVSDSPAGGVSGALTITSPSTGAAPGQFEFKENFEAGTVEAPTVVTIGSIDPSFTVLGNEQKGYVYLSNPANAMDKIRVAGAGFPTADTRNLYAKVPGNLGSAEIEFIVPAAANPGALSVDSVASPGTVNYNNPLSVLAGAHGNLYVWGSGLAGTVTFPSLTLKDGSEFRFSAMASNKTSIGTVAVAAASTATVTTAGHVTNNPVTAEALVVPAGSRLIKNGTGQLKLPGPNPGFHGTLEMTAGALDLSTARWPTAR